MSMVAEGLTGQKWGPELSAPYSIGVGARAWGGTDMALLGRRAAERFGLLFSTTSSIDGLVAGLRAGAWAIANVGGDRPGYTGLFSDAGHYIVVKGMSEDHLTVWDPMLYSGKFSRAGRAGRVTQKGSDIYVLPSVLDRDCEARSPRYYIFKEKPMTPEDFNKLMDNWLAAREKLGESPWSEDEGAFEKLRGEGIMNGQAPRAFVTREELAAVIIRGRRG